MTEQVSNITQGLSWLYPELFLSISFLFMLIAGMFRINHYWYFALTLLIFSASIVLVAITGFNTSFSVFANMLQVNSLSSYFKLLIDVAALLTGCMAVRDIRQHRSEFYALLIAVVLGAHLLSMTSHSLMIFMSLEVISIGSYVLTAFSFNKTGTEGSLKYFLFGAVASSVMLYGLSILYGLTGSLDFTSQNFTNAAIANPSLLFFVACFLVLAGFLYKIAAFPMHIWSPDVYQSAPLSVIAFLSVVPKLAGFSILIKYILSVHLYGQSPYDWQLILAVIAILTLTVGNFAALYQTSAKRLMAYSSIAQSGFLLIGIAAFLPQGINSLLFYATVYLFMNFSVLMGLLYFEHYRLTSIADFAGAGKRWIFPMLLMLIGFISLTGLPPTAGFTSKLLVFSTLWQAYEVSGKSILLILFVFGLLNTVVSLFYYLRIPYFAYLKNGQPTESQNIVTVENLLSAILVLALLILFFLPELLMGWINKINFVL
jgi:NADH-quinone oxidoreductase subunit N